MLEIQLVVCGIKVDEPYRGNLFALDQCEVISSGKSVPDCVHIDYKRSIEGDPSVCEQRYINRVVPREVDLFLQSLSLLSRHPSHLIGYKATLDGVAAEPKVQQYAPSLHNLAEMLNRGRFTPSGLSTCPSREFWGLLENTISSYRERPDDVNRRVTLALRWFKKGIDELNSSDRLVAFWISFNALYEDRNYSQTEAIKKYICKKMDSEMAQRYTNVNKLALKLYLSCQQKNFRYDCEERETRKLRLQNAWLLYSKLTRKITLRLLLKLRWPFTLSEIIYFTASMTQFQKMPKST